MSTKKMVSPPTALTAALALLLLLDTTDGYDINCLWPPDMPDPPEALGRSRRVYNDDPRIRSETPISIYVSQQTAMCPIGCLAYHDAHMLSPFTMERPRVDVPAFGHNTHSRILCTVQCYYTHGNLIAGTQDSEEAEEFLRLVDRWGLTVRQEEDMLQLRDAWTEGRLDDVTALVASVDYDPLVIGQMVALEADALSRDDADGWNRDGSYVYDRRTGEKVRCTANCVIFTDTTGYRPVGVDIGPGEDKYRPAGDTMRWQPLREHQGYGSCVHQEHVVPHIGYTTKPILRPLLEVEAPPYTDYRAEALSVVEQLRITASDSVRKAAIPFYDVKTRVRRALIGAVHDLEDPTTEEKMLFQQGLNMVEHDALISAWRGKVKYDLVRPTTVIRQWGDDELLTFGGDVADAEPKTIRARDFEAVIRVMPHSEYPSGSAALCKAYAEFAQAYATGLGLGELKDIEAPFPIPDVDYLIKQCGDSRLWGGLHFNASIAAGYAIVEGLGGVGFEYLQRMRNGSNFTSMWRDGDPAPAANGTSCPDRTWDMTLPPPTTAPTTKPPTLAPFPLLWTTLETEAPVLAVPPLTTSTSSGTTSAMTGVTIAIYIICGLVM